VLGMIQSERRNPGNSLVHPLCRRDKNIIANPFK
jgi:hypothetical protein